MSAGDIKKFVQVVEDIETRKTITSPVLNVPAESQPSMLGKYFKTIETELQERAEEKKKNNSLLAERVANNINKRLKQAKNPKQKVEKSAVDGSKKLLQKEDKALPKPQNTQSWKLSQKTGSGAHRDKKREQKAGVVKHKKAFTEEINTVDTVKTDVPLLIRLLEYAREDAKTDMDLHNVAENLIELSKDNETLTMDHYDQIVNDRESSDVSEEHVKHADPEKIKRRIMAMAHLMDDDFGAERGTAETIAKIYKLDPDKVQEILSGQGEFDKSIP